METGPVGETINWLLNLRDVDLGASNVHLEWPNAPAPWLSLLLIAALIAYVLMVYRREGGSPFRRGLLASVRCAVVVVVLLLIFQPQLRVERSRTDPALVSILLDHSGSLDQIDRWVDAEEELLAARGLGLVDAGASTLSAEAREALRTKTRRDQLHAAMDQPVFGELLRSAGAEQAPVNQLEFHRFGASGQKGARVSSVESLPAAIADLRSAGTLPGGTSLWEMVRKVAIESRGSRPAGLVLLTDGRDTTGRMVGEAIEAARLAEIRVFPVLLGSSAVPRDVAVRIARAERNVFLNDFIAVNAIVETRGYPEGLDLTVRLQDENGVQIESKPLRLEPGARRGQVEFVTRVTRPGDVSFQVVVDAQPDETDSRNNIGTLSVTAVDRTIRVLYVEDLPRWEYRFLNTMLVRERTISSSLWLHSAVGTGFIQEGTKRALRPGDVGPIRALPATQESLRQYDVILLGDINPREALTREQLDLIVWFARERGGGVGFIAGPQHGPSAFLGTELEKLLPVIPQRRSGPDLAVYSRPFQPIKTADGRISHLLRFEQDPDRSERVWERLPPFFWSAAVERAKDGAVTLLEVPDARRPTPLLVTSNYGVGRIVYMGTDETWRWRDRVGEAHFQTFWLSVVRHLARNTLLSREDLVASLQTSSEQVELGQPIGISLDVFGSALLGSLGESVMVRVADEAGQTAADVVLTRAGATSSSFSTTWPPPSTGRFTVTWRSGNDTHTAQFDVRPSDQETRDLSTDFNSLRELAKATGGQALWPAEIGKLADLIGDQSRRRSDDIIRTQWDSNLAVVLILLLLTVEWVLRKLSGLI